jgi:ATP-dependent DNA helicase RecG
VFDEIALHAVATFRVNVLGELAGGTVRTPEVTEQVTREVAQEVAPEVAREVTPEVRLMAALTGEMSRQQLQAALGLKDDEHFRTAYLVPALRSGLVEMTHPGKPRSSRQRYRLTDKGRAALAARGGEART